MSNFILIGVCLVAGMLFRKYKSLGPDSYISINYWIIYIALPAVSFKYLPYIKWNTDLLLPIISPIVVWLGAWIWITMYSSKTKLDKATEGGLKLTSGLANTSFVGFPLVSAYFGEAAVGIAIICDQITFIILSTAGLVVALNSSDGHRFSVSLILKKLIQFPPFIGCVLAIVLPRYVDISPVAPLFDRLAGTVGPLALFSVGLQLQFDGWKEEIRNISMALFYKLLIAPLLVLSLVLWLNAKGVIAQVSIFEAAMASLVSSGVVTSQYNLNPKTANLIIGIGIVFSFITTFFWWLIIRHLG